VKYITLASGDSMPMLGLGTWKAEPGIVYDAIRKAIELGYRHFDCAAIYGNESEIGSALKDAMTEGDVTRSELFITSKLWNDAHREADVEPALMDTLSDLQLDYLDLYLIHWPVAVKPGIGIAQTPEEFFTLDEVPLSETWRAMEACVDKGLLRNIGVSNFSAAKLCDLLDHGRIQPAVNQIEAHPLLRQQTLKDFCDANGIVITAYSPLGSTDRPAAMKAADEPSLFALPAVEQIAANRACSPVEVLIAWALNRGTAVIPKSVNPVHMASNLACTTLDLTQEEMQQLDSLDRHYRYVTAEFFAVERSTYTAASIWDE
jgi:alcohol dehydrogenase (NADP+)